MPIHSDGGGLGGLAGAAVRQSHGVYGVVFFLFQKITFVGPDGSWKPHGAVHRPLSGIGPLFPIDRQLRS